MVRHVFFQIKLVWVLIYFLMMYTIIQTIKNSAYELFLFSNERNFNVRVTFFER